MRIAITGPTGLLLSVLGAIIWLVIPPKPDSSWKTDGAFKKRRPATEAKMGRGGPGGAGPTNPGPADQSAS